MFFLLTGRLIKHLEYKTPSPLQDEGAFVVPPAFAAVMQLPAASFSDNGAAGPLMTLCCASARTARLSKGDRGGISPLDLPVRTCHWLSVRRTGYWVLGRLLSIIWIIPFTCSLSSTWH
jgi:hypothetical protein